MRTVYYCQYCKKNVDKWYDVHTHAALVTVVKKKDYTRWNGKPKKPRIYLEDKYQTLNSNCHQTCFKCHGVLKFIKEA